MITGLIIIAIVIVIAVGAVLWYLYDEYKTYQDKYEWMRSQRDRARQELYETKINENTKAKQITMNVNVDTDEVVSKLMQGVNKKIEDIKKKEQVYIKVDGKEMNINEVTKALKKVGSNLE